MIELVLSAIIIIAIMLFYIFFIFRNIIGRLNMNARKYFIDKLQDYDKIIDIKKKELEILEKKIQELEEKKEYMNKGATEDDIQEVSEFVAPKQFVKSKEFEKPQVKQKEEIYDIPTPEFREEQFFNTYRSVKQKFDIDNEEIIKKFIEEHTDKKQQTKYSTLKKFKNYFDAETIYQCLTLTKEEQYDILQEVTKKREKQILELDKYQAKDFDLTKFLEDIDEKMRKMDPTIYVYVGDKNTKYEYLSERIKTSLYKNMIEGIIISYQGQIYDYSI